MGQQYYLGQITLQCVGPAVGSELSALRSIGVSQHSIEFDGSGKNIGSRSSRTGWVIGQNFRTSFNYGMVHTFYNYTKEVHTNKHFQHRVNNSETNSIAKI